MEIFQNPAAIMKHMSDPVVQKIMGKLGKRMGAFGGAAGAGFPNFGGGASAETYDGNFFLQ